MDKFIITSGTGHIDIDAYACIVALTELYRLQDKEVKGILSAPINESVTKTIRRLHIDLEEVFSGDNKEYKYVIVDVSDPKFLPDFVNKEFIIKIFDHRWGFEQYWSEKLGKNSIIEYVGSCGTLIWEEFKKAKKQTEISQTSAELLCYSIISNTLNLRAKITNERDKVALDELLPFAKFKEGWDKDYFDEVSQAILKDPIGAMKKDNKIIDINGKTFTMIQIELWDNRLFIEKYIDQIKKCLLEAQSQFAFFTSPNISKGYNFIVVLDNNLKRRLEKTIDIKFEGDIGITKGLYLRKEIMKELQK